MHRLQLVPECYAETTMVKELFFDFDYYLNHASGISQVNSILKKEDIDNYINIGFVDNDKKNVPPYFDEFETIGNSNNVVLKKHPLTNDYLLVVNPAIEGFLLSQLNEIGKSPIDYDLSINFKEFKHKMKKQSIQHHAGYKRMLNDLKDANPEGIRFIIDTVNSLQNVP